MPNIVAMLHKLRDWLYRLRTFPDMPNIRSLRLHMRANPPRYIADTLLPIGYRLHKPKSALFPLDRRQALLRKLPIPATRFPPVYTAKSKASLPIRQEFPHSTKSRFPYGNHWNETVLQSGRNMFRPFPKRIEPRCRLWPFEESIQPLRRLTQQSCMESKTHPTCRSPHDRRWKQCCPERHCCRSWIARKVHPNRCVPPR